MTKTDSLAGLQASLNNYFGFASDHRARHAVHLIEQARLDKNALARAKRLAAKHGVRLDKDGQDGWWVSHDKLTDIEGIEDPLEGNHFCEGGTEVLQAVEVYVKALEAA